MNIIDRYIFRELMKVFAISVFALTLLLYLDKFLFMAEMIVNRGVSFVEMLRIMVYISPSFLALTIPISVLVASVVTFNQFSAANEWIAMKFSSRSFLDLLKPVFIFSLLTYFLANAVIFYALPWGNHAYKKLIFDIIRHRATFDIKPNVFYIDFDNLVLLVKERDTDSRMKGVFIANGQESGQPQIISAEEGIIFSDPDSLKIQLKLKNGTIHEFNKERKDYQTLNFKGYDLSLKLPSTEKLEKKALVDNRDRSLSQQLERIDRLKEEGRPHYGSAVALSKKFSIPFTCLLFALFGAPLGIKSSRSGKSGSFAMSIFIIMGYYICLIFSQNIGKANLVNPYFSVWIPNILLLIAGAYAIYKMHKEIPFSLLDRAMDALVDFATLIAKYLSRFTSTRSMEVKISGSKKQVERLAQPILEEKLKDIKSTHSSQ